MKKRNKEQIPPEQLFHQLLPHIAHHYLLNRPLSVHIEPYTIDAVPTGGHIGIEIFFNGKFLYFESVQRVYLEQLWRLNYVEDD